MILALIILLSTIMPAVLVKKFVKTDKGVFITGWLAWVLGASSKTMVALVLTFTAGDFIAASGLSLVVFIILEALELLVALIVLRSLKRFNMTDLFGFAAGFGLGEAWTVGLLYAVPANIPLTFSQAFSQFLAWFSAISVNIISVVFLGVYLKKEKRRDLGFSLASKIFSVIPLLLSGLSGGQLVIDVVTGFYAFFWFVVLFYRLGKVRLGKPKKNVEFRSKKLVSSIIVSFSALIVFNASSALLNLGSISSVSLLVLIFFLASLALFWKEFSYRVVGAGVFLGACVSAYLKNFFLALDNPALFTTTSFNVLTTPLVCVAGVLLGIGVWEKVLVKKKSFFWD